jgi:toxin ParE1/3/4
MSKYRLTRRADQDLTEIYLYTLEQFGFSQAEAYAESMRHCFETLADNPRMKARGPHPAKSPPSRA